MSTSSIIRKIVLYFLHSMTLLYLYAYIWTTLHFICNRVGKHALGGAISMDCHPLSISPISRYLMKEQHVWEKEQNTNQKVLRPKVEILKTLALIY